MIRGTSFEFLEDGHFRSDVVDEGRAAPAWCGLEFLGADVIGDVVAGIGDRRPRDHVFVHGVERSDAKRPRSLRIAEA